MLVVAGGEVLSTNPWQTLSSVEAIAAGDTAWTVMPNMPTGLHGVGGLLHGNAFYTLGGTTAPGAVLNPGIVQVLRW